MPLAVPHNPSPELVNTRLRDMDVALENLLQLEEAVVAGKGVIKITWIRRMQELARHLDTRATERLMGLARQQEADGMMNRDASATAFGLI